MEGPDRVSVARTGPGDGQRRRCSMEVDGRCGAGGGQHGDQVLPHRHARPLDSSQKVLVYDQFLPAALPASRHR
jgi:hypothetical protein